MNDKLKNVIFPELARIGQALASPTRLELLDWLCQRPFSVEELARATGASVASVSHHLQVLRRSQLVDVKVTGTWRHYSIRPGVPRLWKALMAVGNENLAEIQLAMAEFLRDPEGFTAVGSKELRRRMKNGEVVVIDVRPPGEFEEGHFPGAVSVPMEKLEEKVGGLPADREVVAYCRGPYCLLSHAAVAFLKEHGFRARRWTAGPPDWLAEGLVLERGSSAVG